MTRADLDDFVACYRATDSHNRQATWSKATPDGRWRPHAYEEILARDKVSFDLFWLRDDSLEDSASLPEPHLLAQEITDDLRLGIGADRGRPWRFGAARRRGFAPEGIGATAGIMSIGEKRPLPTYGEAPLAISHALAEIGRLWAESAERPRVSLDLRQAWDGLIDRWAASELPLVIRKSGNIRGAAILHETGREIVLADNSPAQWAFMRAYTGHGYSLADIQEMLARDVIPFAYATKAAEKAQMKFRCTLAGPDNVNKCGWKLCHIDDIGLSTRTPAGQVSLATLVRHFKLFMKPSNHFVVPLAWSGLGEVREVIEAIRTADAS